MSIFPLLMEIFVKFSFIERVHTKDAKTKFQRKIIVGFWTTMNYLLYYLIGADIFSRIYAERLFARNCVKICIEVLLQVRKNN